MITSFFLFIYKQPNPKGLQNDDVQVARESLEGSLAMSAITLTVFVILFLFVLSHPALPTLRHEKKNYLKIKDCVVFNSSFIRSLSLYVYKV